jgi:alpha-tubulin N-acetyltransferase 1
MNAFVPMKHPGVRFLHPSPNDHIGIVRASKLGGVSQSFISLVNDLGSASSRAQGLPHVITTFDTFTSDGNTLYILLSDDHTTALGFLKVGPRHLFLWDRMGHQRELELLCLLDFFTFPNEQRKGYGRRMIDRMLREEHCEMKCIPIDRPSSLCLQFMKKHFGLSKYIVQANKFVVFDEFWETNPKEIRDQPMTPPRKAVTRSATEPHSRTPAAHRTGLNPITWLPYD